MWTCPKCKHKFVNTKFQNLKKTDINDELKSYIDSFESGIGGKNLNITKFLRTIDAKFNEFLSLSARAVANFVNPNLVILPNFSQQLNPNQPFISKVKKTIKIKNKSFAIPLDREGFVQLYKKLERDYKDIDEERLQYEDVYRDFQRQVDDFSGEGLTTEDERRLQLALANVRKSGDRLKKLDASLEKIRERIRFLNTKPQYRLYIDDLIA